MATYQSALNMRYGDWVNRQAALDDITPSELEKRVEITPIKVTEWAVWMGDSKKFAIQAFDRVAKDFDVVTDLYEGIASTGVLGVMWEYYFINGTGIKLE